MYGYKEHRKTIKTNRLVHSKKMTKQVNEQQIQECEKNVSADV